VPALRDRYGADNVVATGHKTKPGQDLLSCGAFHYIDCTDIKRVAQMVKKYNIDTIFNLAVLLSAKAELHPRLAWKVNVDGLGNVLEIAREYKCSVFTPSTIGVFGPDTPMDNTPQTTIQRPSTIYGISKVTGELLCDYY
jgi:nucleoside-diphosphate-sugar epimerase